MNVREMIEMLEGFDPDAEIRLASQPSWPMQHYIAEVAEVELPLCRICDEDEEDDDCDCDGETQTMIYIGEGDQPYSDPYLPGAARRELGWGD